MFKLKLKINAKVPQLLCIVVSVALNGEFERFGGFCVDWCYTTIHSNRGTFAFILSLINLDILRYEFTILRLFNILPYISLYFEHKQTHCLCGLLVVLRVCRETILKKQLRAWFPEGQNNGQQRVLGDKKKNYESFVALVFFAAVFKVVTQRKLRLT